MSLAEFSPFAKSIATQKNYIHENETEWSEVGQRVSKEVFRAVDLEGRPLQKVVGRMIGSRQFMPGGRYLYASGRPFHQTQNCLLLKVADSREGWSDLLHKASMALMTGAGIGVDYSSVREEGAVIHRTGGLATGPIALMQMVNECGRGIMQGGSRRSAIWAGLNWRHPDASTFVRSKNWSYDIRKLKEKDFSFPAKLDQTNISIQLDDAFFTAYHDPRHSDHALATTIYWAVVRQMLETAEPGFSIDVGRNAGETLRNACTEITSADSNDICNLGSLNMGRFDTIREFEAGVAHAVAFLLAGTVYSDIPYPEVDVTRTKNRRLGLGLMGVHEWLLQRGKKYGPDDELGEWLNVYRHASRQWADYYSHRWRLSRPAKVCAIAPTGTISIVAETSSGMEPIFCVAYKRRYLRDGKNWVYQYVVDPVVKRLIESGVNPDRIEDAYSLASNIERRVEFQAWLQDFVDHGISSTINLPHWGSDYNNEGTVRDFGSMLMKYLPRLRGVTCYPDGARGGQPLTPVPYLEAVGQEGIEIIESGTDICSISGKGSCGE